MGGLMASLLLLCLFALLAVPVLLLGLLLGAAVYLVAWVFVLPFRLLGWTARVGLGVIGSFMKLFFLLLAGLFSLVALLLGLFPLIAVVLLCFGLWLILRPSVQAVHRGAYGEPSPRV